MDLSAIFGDTRDQHAGPAVTSMITDEAPELDEPDTWRVWTEPAPPPGCADWIARRGADGRLGWDRPGTPVASRWWQYSSFDELPEPRS